MNSTGHIISTSEGERYCRRATWVDLIQFFALNYGLHAFTVVSRPGGGALYAFVDGLAAIILPFSGMFRAIYKLSKSFYSERDSLQVAYWANALCMLVPASSNHGEIFSPIITNIHGQHPITVPSIFELIKSPLTYSRLHSDEASEACRLVGVPGGFVVRPLPTSSDSAGQQVQLAGNLSFMKTSAAIIQIIYSSYELYHASKHQFNQLGYAAYSITTVPYILMSFMNLLASLSEPSYPSIFLVYHCPGGVPFRGTGQIQRAADIGQQCSCACLCGKRRDEEEEESPLARCNYMIGGAVGCAYDLKDWVHTSSPDHLKFRKGLDEWDEMTHGKVLPLFLFLGLASILIVLPYIIIALLTRYNTGESTTSERAWVICSLVFGQVLWVFVMFSPFNGIVYQAGRMISASAAERGGFTKKIEYWLQFPINSLLGLLLFTIIMSPPTIGMFVTVARMILQDEVCAKVSAPLS